MATEFDISQAAAQVYAESLLDLADDAHQAEEVGEELNDLLDLWNRDPAFAVLMSSAAVDQESRAGSLRRIFQGRVGPLVYNLLMILNRKQRAMVLPHVVKRYHQLLAQRRNRTDVWVTSAVPLAEEHRKNLCEQIQRATGLEPVLREQLDPELLGGLAVQVGDRVYDNTVRRRLRDMRRELIGSAERHLRGGSMKFVS